MHVAAMIGLLGFAGSVSGLLKVLTGNLGPRPNAAIAQAVMAGLMLIFVAMCVRSFINARRSRTV
jgi:amino acid transporter